MMRKIAFWGAGKYGRTMRILNPNIIPDFFIDSNKNLTSYLGVDVIHPDDITDWKSIFIYITSANDIEIIAYLESKGMTKGLDYLDSSSIWGEDVSGTSEINEIEEWVNTTPNSTNRIVMILPLTTGRQSENLLHFFSEYFRCRNTDNYLVLNLGGRKKMIEYISSILPVKCFAFPRTDKLDNLDKINSELYNYEIEEIKNTRVTAANENIVGIFTYLETIMTLLAPKQCYIWGGWVSISLIAEQVLKKHNIKYGFFEHGWLPGTIQFDRKGIAGKSDCCRNYTFFNSTVSEEEKKKCIEVIDCIVKNRYDSGTEFIATDRDQQQFMKIQSNKPTVFLVGMDDSGMGINNRSQFWKEYVSETVSSTYEAVECIKTICLELGFNFMFKPHPTRNAWFEYDEDDENLIYIRDANIDELIERSDVVVSIASAVDYKVLMYKKPLIHIGHSAMEGCGCDYYVGDKTYLQQTLQNAMNNGLSKEQKDRYVVFISQLLKSHLWDDMTPRKMRYGLSLKDGFMNEN